MNPDVGVVESVKNEICTVKGLRTIGLSNVVTFSSGGQGIVLGFNPYEAQVIMFKDYRQVKRGDLVRIVADAPSITVSESLLGRVIDPLGEPIDGLGVIDSVSAQSRPIESRARPVYQRRIIDQPLQTGYIMIDSQIPIGLGQRELLLGERKSGQNDLAVDIICNQARLNTGLISVYVIVDAETALAKRRIERLASEGALKNTVVVLGRAAQAASLNYVAPMAGTSIAEWFADSGRDVLIIYDDMSRHAKVYRQLSLLLNRPASREAYPGDIFYLHSRLLERSGAFNEQAGGGSITALPIVETQTEEATDFITTNLMSITDGHVLFRQTLANKGVTPAVDSGFSVSRIGGRAQHRLIRELSEKIKSITIRYAEIERFLAFGTDMSTSSRDAYELGKGAAAVMNQTASQFYSPVQQVVLMYLIVSKEITRWDESQVGAVKDALLQFLARPPYADLMNEAMLELGIKEASLMLQDCLKDFRQSPDTPQPIEKKSTLTAETETISQILHENEEAYGKA